MYYNFRQWLQITIGFTFIESQPRYKERRVKTQKSVDLEPLKKHKPIQNYAVI